MPPWYHYDKHPQKRVADIGFLLQRTSPLRGIHYGKREQHRIRSIG